MDDDKNIYDILASFKNAIDYMIDKIDAMDKMGENIDQRVDDLEKTIYDDILNPAMSAVQKFDHNRRLDDFKGRFGERLGAYNDKLTPLEGEDFDLTSATFDNYDAIPEEDRPDEEEYVSEVERLVKDKLDSIRSAMGIPEDAPIKVEEDAEGDVTVESEGETQVVDEEVKDEVPEEPKVQEGDEEIVDEAEVTEDNPDDVAAFEEELKKSLK